MLADAGLPVPPGVVRIDLGFAPHHPRVIDVLQAVVGELVVEGVTLAEPARDASPEVVAAVSRLLPQARTAWVDHDEFKRRCGAATAIVVTGEFTPFANVMVHAGVGF